MASIQRMTEFDKDVFDVNQGQVGHPEGLIKQGQSNELFNPGISLKLPEYCFGEFTTVLLQSQMWLLLPLSTQRTLTIVWLSR